MNMMMQGLAMARRIHVGDDKDSLFMHKHHMIQQTLSHSSKVVASSNLKILTLGYCWIKMARSQTLENLELNKIIKYIQNPFWNSNLLWSLKDFEFYFGLSIDNYNAHWTWCWFKTLIIIKYWKLLWSKYIMISSWTFLSKWHHSSKAFTTAKNFCHEFCN
jgi:hypothetical protein